MIDTDCDCVWICDNYSAVLFTNNASTNTIYDSDIIYDCGKNKLTIMKKHDCFQSCRPMILTTMKKHDIFQLCCSMIEKIYMTLRMLPYNNVKNS